MKSVERRQARHRLASSRKGASALPGSSSPRFCPSEADESRVASGKSHPGSG